MTSDPALVAAPHHGDDATAVDVQAVTKTYGKVTALDGVDFTLRQGTVHGLVGENGSGKSTLTKIIAGVVHPDSGTIVIDGKTITETHPRTSLAHGVRVIFQDLAVFPNMTVAENIVFEGDRPFLRRVSDRKDRARAREALDGLGLKIDPRARLGDLPAAERQLVAIARTVSSDGRIILMDEPTAALTHHEIDRLLTTTRTLSEKGLSFVFISHKLREVVSVADDVTVIRDGQIISTGPSNDYDQDRITFLMTGGAIERAPRERHDATATTPVVQIRDLTLREAFHNVDLDVHEGHVLGLAGLVGSGRIEIGLAIAGLVQPESGEIRYRGEVEHDMLGKSRLQYVPDDRLTEGLFLDWPVADNIVINDLAEALGPGGTLSTEKINRIAEKWRDNLRIKTPSVANPVSSLSGGNQQRVLLARTLAPGPDIIILNNPTVGVDVGSRVDIHNLIQQVASLGTAVLMISDEPAELLSVCDDVVFIHEGRVIDRRPSRDLSEEGLLDIVGQGTPS